MRVVQEPDRVNPRFILIVTVVSILVTALGVAIAAGIIGITEQGIARATTEDGRRTPARLRGQPDEVNHIEMTLFKNELTAPDLRTQALQRLRSYGYVDRQRQIVHIPIERAFDLYLERQRRGTEGASLTPATRDDAALEETGRL